jgi:hypothetical protein
VVHSLSIVLLAFMEGYAIARTYARLGRYTLHINQVTCPFHKPIYIYTHCVLQAALVKHAPTQHPWKLASHASI